MEEVALAAASWVVLGMVVIALEMLGQHAVSNALGRLRDWVRNREIGRRAELISDGAVDDSLTALYRPTPVGEGLVELCAEFGGREVALYSPSAWRVGAQAVHLGETTLVDSDGAPRLDEDRDGPKPPVIRRREARLGDEIWDGDSLHVTALPESYSAPVEAKSTGYFDIGSRGVGSVASVCS